MSYFRPGVRKNDMHKFLPVSLREANDRGWDDFDVILFTGDAYVDHPAFGAAVIGRIIEDEGLKIGIVPQPNWRDDLRDFKKLGRPNLFFGVTAGNMDSMVNHYTAMKRRRSGDAYSPGGRAGFRPDYPTIVYTRILKEIFPDTPVVIGGIEASMRRIAHYDYWSDRVEPSILISSGADMLLYGMAGQTVRTLAKLLTRGVPFGSLDNLPQTVIKKQKDEALPPGRKWGTINLPSFNEVVSDAGKYSEAFVLFERESNKIISSRLVQDYPDSRLVVNPQLPLVSTEELDREFGLPYTRVPHPKYFKKPPIPACEMIKFSVSLHRGCFGGCSFCAISVHQGKHVVSRSERSVLEEIEEISKLPDFKGVISDLGGPSANMYMMKGINIELCKNCSRPSCAWPSVCKNLDTDHGSIVRILKKVRELPYIKKAFVTSGIRYDLCLKSYNKKAGTAEKEFLQNVITFHTSGRFKVGPEHTQDHILDIMRKPSFNLFRELAEIFKRVVRNNNLNYEIVPYFISGHPGTTNSDMAELAAVTREMDLRPEQVQGFTPTPGTLSSAIYYTGKDPYTGRKIDVVTSEKGKRDQNLFFFWYKKENRKRIEELLKSINRPDLINKLFGRR